MQFTNASFMKAPCSSVITKSSGKSIARCQAEPPLHAPIFKIERSFHLPQDHQSSHQFYHPKPLVLLTNQNPTAPRQCQYSLHQVIFSRDFAVLRKTGEMAGSRRKEQQQQSRQKTNEPDEDIGSVADMEVMEVPDQQNVFTGRQKSAADIKNILNAVRYGKVDVQAIQAFYQPNISDLNKKQKAPSKPKIITPSDNQAHHLAAEEEAKLDEQSFKASQDQLTSETFASLSLSKLTLKSISMMFKFEHITKVQKLAIPILLQGD